MYICMYICMYVSISGRVDGFVVKGPVVVKAPGKHDVQYEKMQANEMLHKGQLIN